MMNKREKYLDIVKAFAILMVVNVHFPFETSLFKRITFHLTSFFMISGILIVKKEEYKLQFKDLLKKKIKAIIWPYFTLSILYILIKGILNLSIPINDIYYTVTFLGIGTLWFFPTLFLGELICIVILKKSKNNYYIFPILTIMSIFIGYLFTKYNITGSMYLDKSDILKSTVLNLIIVIMQSIICASYIGLGGTLQYLIQKFKLLKDNRCIHFILGIILLIINYVVAYNVNDNLRFVTINHPIRYLFCSCIGALGILNIAYSIENIKYISDFFSWLGRNSIIIMTTHLEYNIVNLGYWFVSLMSISNTYLFSIIMFIFILIIEAFIICVINNTKLRVLYKFPQSKKG